MSVEHSTSLCFGCKCNEHYDKILSILDSLPDSEEKEWLEGAAEEYIFHLDAWSGEGVFFGERITYFGDDEWTYSFKQMLELKEKYTPASPFLALHSFLVKQIPDFPPLDFYIVNRIY